MSLPNFDNPTNHINTFTSAIIHDDVEIYPRLSLKRRYVSGGNDAYDAEWTSITSYLLKNGLSEITWGVDDSAYLTGITKNANINILMDNSERKFSNRTNTDSLWYDQSTEYYLENSLIKVEFVAELRDGTTFISEQFSGLLKFDTMKYSLDGTKAVMTLVSKLDYLKTKHLFSVIDEKRQFKIDALGIYDRVVSDLKTTLPSALELTFPCMCIKNNFFFTQQSDLNSDILNYTQHICSKSGSIFGINRSNEIFITHYDNSDSFTAQGLSIPAAYTFTTCRYYKFGVSPGDSPNSAGGTLYDKAYLTTYSGLSFPLTYVFNNSTITSDNTTTGKFNTGREFFGIDGIDSSFTASNFFNSLASIEFLYRFTTISAIDGFSFFNLEATAGAAQALNIIATPMGYRGKHGIGTMDEISGTIFNISDYAFNKNWTYFVANIDNTTGTLPSVNIYINGIKAASFTSLYPISNMPGIKTSAAGGKLDCDFLRIQTGNIPEDDVIQNTKKIFGSKNYFSSTSSYTFCNTGPNKNILRIFDYNLGTNQIKNRIEVYRKDATQYKTECVLPAADGTMWVLGTNGKLSVYSFTSIETSNFSLTTSLKDIFNNIPGFDITQTSYLNIKIMNTSDEISARSTLFHFKDRVGNSFQTSTSDYKAQVPGLTLGTPYIFLIQSNEASSLLYENTASVQEYGPKIKRFSEIDSIFTDEDSVSRYATGILDSYAFPKIKMSIEVSFLEGDIDILDRVTVEYTQPFINSNGFIISESNDLVSNVGFATEPAGNIDWETKDFYVIGIQHNFNNKKTIYKLREV